MPRNFQPLQLQPGLVRAESPAAAPGRWYDANLVRWEGGNVSPIGGWTEYLPAAGVGSRIRKVHSWTDNGGIGRTALLCENAIYVIEGNNLTNITPTGGFLKTPNIPYVGGYGTGPYGTGAFGTLRPVSDTYKYVSDAYSLDNWGQTLLIMTSFDGRLLQWDPSVANSKAAAVSGAPVGNRFFDVTNERHVVLWQIGGAQNSFGWCSQENLNDWNFASVTNSAGQYDIQPASPILASVRCKTGIVFFTNNSSYLLAYQGSPFIYTFAPLSDTAIPVSEGAIAEYAGMALWFSGSCFWRFDGSSVSPLPCDILDTIIDDIDPLYGRIRTFIMNLQFKNELWMFYPSAGHTENNRLIIWNYVDNWWSRGDLNRTCGYRASYTAYPLLSDGTKLYFHEKGGEYVGYSGVPFVESGALTTKNGMVKGTLKQMIVDNSGANTSALYSFTGRNRAKPSEPSNNVVPPKMARDDGYLDVRITARDISIRIQSAQSNRNDWSFGIPLVDIKVRGAR